MTSHRVGPVSTRVLAVVATLSQAAACVSTGAPIPAAMPSPSQVYDVWVTSEAVDQIAHIRFDGANATIVERRPVGSMPVELEGPHGIAISPDARFAYVTLGHGLPNGSLLKIDLASGRVAGRAVLGRFPATVAVTPDGATGFVSNFNLHGDHVPSSISMIDLASMQEIARTDTCVMPHGSRVNPAGTRHYSVCMMDDVLIEIDAMTGSILRSLSVRPGMEGATNHELHAPGAPMLEAEPACSPTWAEPGADGTHVYVTCNRAREVLEIDVDRWEIVRRFPTGENPYNLAVAPDGRSLLVSLRNRLAPGLEVFDLTTGRLEGRVASSTTLAHGIAVSEDSRYAFVTAEGVGSEPGKLDIVDLSALRRVASVSIGQQATGVAMVPRPE